MRKRTSTITALGFYIASHLFFPDYSTACFIPSPQNHLSQEQTRQETQQQTQQNPQQTQTQTLEQKAQHQPKTLTQPKILTMKELFSTPPQELTPQEYEQTLRIQALEQDLQLREQTLKEDLRLKEQTLEVMKQDMQLKKILFEKERTTVENMRLGQEHIKLDLENKIFADDKIYYENRVLTLDEGVTNGSVSNLIPKLLVLDSKNNEPIYLLINSGGGGVIEGLRLIDAMQQLKSPVYTICNGNALSMASVILAAGEQGHRYIYPNSRVMFHNLSGDIHERNLPRQVEAVEYAKKVWEQLVNNLSKYTGQDAKKIKDDCYKKDFFLTAEEALEYGTKGFADKIIGEGEIPFELKMPPSLED